MAKRKFRKSGRFKQGKKKNCICLKTNGKIKKKSNPFRYSKNNFLLISQNQHPKTAYFLRKHFKKP